MRPHKFDREMRRPHDASNEIEIRSLNDENGLIMRIVRVYRIYSVYIYVWSRPDNPELPINAGRALVSVRRPNGLKERLYAHAHKSTRSFFVCVCVWESH